MKRRALVQVRSPAGLRFSDLALHRHPNGDVSFNHAVLARVLRASGVPEGAATEDLHGGIIAGWYNLHREQGGAPDPVMEALIAESEQEAHDDAN